MSTFQNFARHPVGRYAASLQKTGAMWVFHHIPKTAGSSLTREMSLTMAPYRNIFVLPGANLEPASGERTRPDPMMQAVDAFLEARKTQHYLSCSGHMRQNHLRRITEAVPYAKVFTFLRDPTARLISDYRYAKTPKHPPHEEFARRYPTIEAYIDDPSHQNKMWRFVRPRNGPPDDTLLSIAFRRYAFFGLVSDLSLHFQFLSALTTCPRRPEARVNVTSDQADNAVALSGELRSRIEQLNAEDFTLYAAVESALSGKRRELEEFVASRRAFFLGEAAA